MAYAQWVTLRQNKTLCLSGGSVGQVVDCSLEATNRVANRIAQSRFDTWGRSCRFTLMIYTHVLQRGACGVQSPLDRLTIDQQHGTVEVLDEFR